MKRSADVYQAIYTNDEQFMIDYLEQLPNLTNPRIYDDNLTFLMLAAVCGRYKICQLLIDGGSDINAQNSSLIDMTPLHYAVQGKHTTIVRLLVQSGADVMAIDRHGNTPFDKAVSHGLSATLKALLEKNHTQAHPGALFVSIRYNFYSTIDILLQHQYGLNVNAYNTDRRTPIHYAIIKENTRNLQTLLNRNAIVNTTDIHGQTVLHAATMQGYNDELRLLLEQGVLDDQTILPVVNDITGVPQVDDEGDADPEASTMSNFCVIM